MRKILIFFICAILPYAAHALVRDNSIDCAGRPTWDRNIVDTNATDWDAKNAKCFGDTGADKTDPSKLYGHPPMYGEYEG